MRYFLGLALIAVLGPFLLDVIAEVVAISIGIEIAGPQGAKTIYTSTFVFGGMIIGITLSSFIDRMEKETG